MGALPRRHFLTVLIVCCGFVGHPTTARAQDAPPPHAAVVDGAVVLDREDGSTSLTPGMPIVPGDRIRTTSGRAEVMFADGSALDLDENTTIEINADTLLAMNAGRLLLTVAGAADPSRAIRYHIDGPAASMQTESAGEYRLAISAASGDVELAVLRGAASFFGDNGSMLVRAGERSLARDGYPPSAPEYVNSARMDAFDRWAADRRDERMGSAASNQYLPSDLRSYSGTLDHYGSWEYDSSYGYVWYPTVAVGWRPYYYGYWATVPVYGWTWIGLDPWGWPTHHYGRWGYGHSRWFWIPDRRYAPAYVSWAAAPGYVGWSPLGFNNQPVFGLSVAVSNVWAGWTVLPQQHFGVHGVYVNNVALPANQIPRTGFTPLTAAPIPPARVPNTRSAATVASGVAVPRGSTPALNGSAAAFVPNRNAPPSRAVASTPAQQNSAWRAGIASNGNRSTWGARPSSGTEPFIETPPIPSAAPRAPALQRYPSGTRPGTATEIPGSIVIPELPPAGYDSAVRPGMGQQVIPRTAPPNNPPATGTASPVAPSAPYRAIARPALPPPAAPASRSPSGGAAPMAVVPAPSGAPTATASPSGSPPSSSGQTQGSSGPPAGARSPHRSR